MLQHQSGNYQLGDSWCTRARKRQVADGTKHQSWASDRPAAQGDRHLVVKLPELPLHMPQSVSDTGRFAGIWGSVCLNSIPYR